MHNSKIKILFVDDNPQIIGLLNVTFSGSEYKLFNAKTGAEALNLIRTEKPDIVFLDIMMPGDIDGFAVCEYVKSSSTFKKCFVVMLTGKSKYQDESYCLSIGADKYIRKPFRAIELVKLVEQWKKNYQFRFNKLAVLIAVEESANREIIEKTLSQEGHLVFQTNNVTDAMSYFENHKVDLVITDVLMSNRDGTELIFEILHTKPSTKIIAISNRLLIISNHSVGTTKILGVNYILHKPFTAQDVKIAVLETMKN
jgi:DNA-binding response OmpR family regulator